MDFFPPGSFRESDLFFLGAIAFVAGTVSLTVFSVCYFWFRREQRRLQARLLASIIPGEEGGIPVPAHQGRRGGELVAQFKVKQGRQTISVLEADGKRFLHVEGEISAPERARMVRYLKSEGFMS